MRTGGFLFVLAVVGTACAPLSPSAGPSVARDQSTASPTLSVASTPTPTVAPTQSATATVTAPPPSPTASVLPADLAAALATARGGIVRLTSGDLGAYIGQNLVLVSAMRACPGVVATVASRGATYQAGFVDTLSPPPPRFIGPVDPGRPRFDGISALVAEGLDKSGATALRWGDSTALRPGDVVLAVSVPGSVVAEEDLAVPARLQGRETLRDGSEMLVLDWPAQDRTGSRAGGMAALSRARGAVLIFDRSGGLVAIGAPDVYGPGLVAYPSAVARPFVARVVELMREFPVRLDVTDARAFVQPLTSWRPDGPSVIVAEGERRSRIYVDPAGQSEALTAVSLRDGKATRLVAFKYGIGWDWRADGSAFVVAVTTDCGRTARVALWVASSGEVRWLTPMAEGVVRDRPLWSADGTYVYFHEHAPSASTGLGRVTADGTQLGIVDPSPGGVPYLIPIAAPTAGVVIVAKCYEPCAFTALDTATWKEHGTFAGALLSWRTSASPHALVVPCLANPYCANVSGLRLWDDGTSALTTVLDDSLEVIYAAWDPSGSRIVAAMHAARSKEPYVLQTMNADGSARARIAGTEDALEPRWSREGVVYVWARADAWIPIQGAGDALDYVPIRVPPYEIRIVTPGGTPRTLFRSDQPLSITQVVSPP